jgi:hypothetical protein
MQLTKRLQTEPLCKFCAPQAGNRVPKKKIWWDVLLSEDIKINCRFKDLHNLELSIARAIKVELRKGISVYKDLEVAFSPK